MKIAIPCHFIPEQGDKTHPLQEIVTVLNSLGINPEIITQQLNEEQIEVVRDHIKGPYRTPCVDESPPGSPGVENASTLRGLRCKDWKEFKPNLAYPKMSGRKLDGYIIADTVFEDPSFTKVTDLNNLIREEVPAESPGPYGVLYISGNRNVANIERAGATLVIVAEGSNSNADHKQATETLLDRSIPSIFVLGEQPVVGTCNTVLGRKHRINEMPKLNRTDNSALAIIAATLAIANSKCVKNAPVPPEVVLAAATVLSQKRLNPNSNGKINLSNKEMEQIANLLKDIPDIVELREHARKGGKHVFKKL